MLRADANGPKERLVPIPSSALAALRDYLQHGRPLLLRPRKQPRLFVNQHGNGLTRQGIYQIVQGHARTAGLASRSHHARSATPAQRTCSPAASIYRPYKRCSGTPTSPPPSCTPSCPQPPDERPGLGPWPASVSARPPSSYHVAPWTSNAERIHQHARRLDTAAHPFHLGTLAADSLVRSKRTDVGGDPFPLRGAPPGPGAAR